MTSPGETHWLDTEQQRAWRAYLLGTTLLMDRLDRDLRADFDISLPEYEVLVRLSECADHRMRMALLAAAMCHSRSRITHTVSRMEQAGLVERTAAVDDRRGVECLMTEHGYELLQAAAHTHVSGVRDYLVDLADPADYQALGRVFEAVSDKLMVDKPAATDFR